MALPRPTRQPDKPQTDRAPAPLGRKDFRPSDVFRFDPKPDITVEELGYLVSIFWTLDVDQKRFNSFQTELQRHFRPIQDDE